MVKLVSEDLINDMHINDSSKLNCPKRSYLDTNIIIGTDNVIDISNLEISNNVIPMCSNEFYNNDNSGCCITDSICKQDHSMGYKYKNIANDNSNKQYNVCHQDPVQKIYNTFLSHPNKLIQFFKIIFTTMVSLLITSVIGCCYEFWLRYGDSTDCIYYKSKCENIGKSNEISLIDYLFPNSICYYPYQACNTNLSGGSKMIGGEKLNTIISNYVEYKSSGAKCITLNYESIDNNKKPFPYNVADYAINNIDNKIIQIPFKMFSFFFLFPVLVVRYILNWIFKRLSNGYQSFVKHNYFINNIIFLLLTGILFNIIAYFTGVNILHSGPIIYLEILLSFVGLIMMFGVIISLVYTILPDKLLGRALNTCNIDSRYYEIFESSNLFYSRHTGITQRDKFFIVLKNIGLSIFILPIIGLISLITGFTGNILAIIYMNFSLIWKIFYIPLSNYTEFFDILKSHADLLTILFCIGVIVSSTMCFDTVTTSIMSGVLSIIILFKVISAFKKIVKK